MHENKHRNTRVNYFALSYINNLLNFKTRIGQEVRDAVITVPPFFNQAERRAMMEAAEIGGVDLIQLMNDNTAGKFWLSNSAKMDNLLVFIYLAALNYAITRFKTFNETNTKVIIYDMGSTYTTATVIGNTYRTILKYENVHICIHPKYLFRLCHSPG